MTDFQALLTDDGLSATLTDLFLSRKPSGRPDPVLPAASISASEKSGDNMFPGIIGRVTLGRPQRWVGYTVDFYPLSGEVELAIRHAPYPVAGPRIYADALDGATINVPNYGHKHGRVEKTWLRRWGPMDLLEVELVRALNVRYITVAFYTTQLPRAARNHADDD